MGSIKETYNQTQTQMSLLKCLLLSIMTSYVQNSNPECGDTEIINVLNLSPL